VNNPDRTPSPFKSLHHIALVVENLDDSVARLEGLGFGPFVAYPPLSEYTQLDVPDADAFYDLRIMVCEIGPIALQVIEGKDSNTIYGDFLRSRGEGVFHLGFRVDDIESAEQEARHQGLGILSSGRRADGSGFTYFDTASELGVTLLLRQSPPLPS
jgi:4-hydroxyphenylpyruvate dioxygenase-like putative hemolysin